MSTPAHKMLHPDTLREIQKELKRQGNIATTELIHLGIEQLHSNDWCPVEDVFTPPMEVGSPPPSR